MASTEIWHVHSAHLFPPMSVQWFTFPGHSLFSRYPRFSFDGTCLLLLEGQQASPTLAAQIALLCRPQNTQHQAVSWPGSELFFQHVPPERPGKAKL